MMQSTKVVKLLFLLSFMAFCPVKLSGQTLDSLTANLLFTKAQSLTSIHPDSATYIYDLCKRYFEQNHQYANALECLIAMIEIEKKILNYEMAYEHSWDALTIIDRVDDSLIKSRSYRSIGMLYSYFLQPESDEYLTKAIAIDKALLNAGELTEELLIPSYYDLMLQYRYRFNLEIASQYLDTCFMLANKADLHPVNRGFLETEQANLKILNGNYKEALPLLFKVEDIFKNIPEEQMAVNNNKGYLVIIYLYLGNTYSELKEHSKAVEYYYKSLSAMAKYKVHLGASSVVHMNLSLSLKAIGKYEEAFGHLESAKAENDEVYDTRSFSNKKIVQIKNQYKEDLERTSAEIARINLELSEQKADLLEKEKSLLINRVIIGVIVFLLVSGLLFASMWKQRLRLESEKGIISAESKLKEENDRAIIELKNKELTTYTLQYIEKDKTIAELLEHIKENPSDKTSFKKIQQSVKQNESIQWDDFKARFIEVHKDYYNRLVAKHHDLTSSDIKHIALLKLNFTGKEMANILAVSHSTIHVSHYRLKKKLGLEPDAENLKEYINSI